MIGFPTIEDLRTMPAKLQLWALGTIARALKDATRPGYVRTESWYLRTVELKELEQAILAMILE